MLASTGFVMISGASPIEVVSADGFSVIVATPERASGLNDIYVTHSDGPVSISYTSASSANVPKWYRYSSLGGGYAEELSGVVTSGNISVLDNAATDMGYIIEDGDSRQYFWIVGYQSHPLRIESVSVAEESDCDRTILNVAGQGAEIYYYGINGRRFTLDREIEVNYKNLEWSDERSNFMQIDAVKSVQSISHQILVSPPAYCATSFTVTGDRFLREWNMEQSATSAIYQPVAVDCRTTATQAETATENSNQINGGTDGLGGSAPCEITFEAFVTDAVIHTEWQMSSDSGFDNITYRLSGQDLTFTFRDEGTTYVRFVGSNSDGSCETYGETFSVDIGASELKCPNAFSPGASEGVNDEWKVSYRSLVEFECWIFDRYGTQMYHFSDPAGGWDGRYKGKLVSPGVYYYVIKAKGADGKEYKRGGDINILRFKGRQGTGSSSE